jgi:hypothetical protein
LDLVTGAVANPIWNEASRPGYGGAKLEEIVSSTRSDLWLATTAHSRFGRLSGLS